jgi:hypothetical protein
MPCEPKKEREKEQTKKEQKKAKNCREEPYVVI